MNEKEWKKAIAEIAVSDIPAEEVIEEYCRAAGIELSKVQMKYAHRRDEKRRDAARRIQEWRDSGDGIVYTKESIPDFVVEAIKSTGKNFDEEIDTAAKNAFNLDITDFAYLDNVLYFNADGYMRLIAVALSRGWMGRNTKIRWMRETGLYQAYEGSALMREDSYDE